MNTEKNQHKITHKALFHTYTHTHNATSTKKNEEKFLCRFFPYRFVLLIIALWLKLSVHEENDAFQADIVTAAIHPPQMDPL